MNNLTPEQLAFRAGYEQGRFDAQVETAQLDPVMDWTPCIKLPVVVHVRKQRPGEKHVSTREGITPVKPDDLIMRGVSGEEYPIGRDIFEQTYSLETSTPASRPWVGLTDDDIESAMPGGIYDCLADPWDCNVGDGDYMRSIKKDVLRVARAAIAAYEEKNGITGEKA